MSTTSPNFSLVLASSADTVSVTSHIANNFSTLDSLFSIAHTGSGQLKNSLPITTPVLINPVISGTAIGGVFLGASTGSFNTITATGGTVTLNALTATAFAIGTYSYPTTVGATGALLTIVTGNAVFVAPSGGTGANTGLSNLASVAINTNLNTFTAGFVTVARVIATSGALTGITAFQATTGTFAGSVTISGTATINALQCTGGSPTFAGLTIGTYALPSTLGSTGQVLSITSGPALAFLNNAAALKFVSYITFSNTAMISFVGLTAGATYVGKFLGASPGSPTNKGFYFNSASGAVYSVNGYGFMQGALGTGTGALFVSTIATSQSGIIVSSAAFIAGDFKLFPADTASGGGCIFTVNVLAAGHSIITYATGAYPTSVDFFCGTVMTGQYALYIMVTS